MKSCSRIAIPALAAALSLAAAQTVGLRARPCRVLPRRGRRDGLDVCRGPGPQARRAARARLQLRDADRRDRRTRRREPRVRRAANRSDRCRRATATLRRRRSWTSRSPSTRRAATRRGCSGSRSRPTTYEAVASTSTTPGWAATSRSSSIAVRQRTRTSPPGQRAPDPAHRASRILQPQRRANGVRPRRRPLHRRRRRRQRGRSARQRTEQRHVVGKILRIAPSAAGAATRSRAATRSPARPASGPRSGLTACATHGVSPSIAPPAT